MFTKNVWLVRKLSPFTSSGMTGTVQSAQMAWDMLEGKERLTIIDSRKASLGQGLLVLQAARLAEQGIMREKIVEEVYALRERMNCLFTINTLEYLVKGGRVSRTAGLSVIFWISSRCCT